jgi:squalene-hopene/tetraprenyl-beta-curcumene cyclase
MDDARRGRGESTASQTAWALLALLAAETERHDDAIRRGLEYLASTQTADGTWHEPQYTATGFPGYGIGRRVDLSQAHAALAQGVELGRGFMINYNLYRHFFPLMAMGRARKTVVGALEREAAD